MIISALKSSVDTDSRSPIHIDTISTLLNLGADVFFEENIGIGINVSDKIFEQSGLKKSSREECLKKGDLIITNQPLGDDELKLIKPNSTLLGMINPFSNQSLIESCSKLKINLVSMEFIPRITRGVGVAGLQAIATAKRLGARVEAFDTRDVVEEQVNSLGAKFVKIDLGETGETDQGYAKELSEEQIKKQKELQSKVCERSDIVITTAQLFGRPAPLLVDNKTIDRMMPGSVIFDMAVESGGNVEGSEVDKVVERNGIKIIGISNLASKVSNHASLALSNNYNNWISDFFDKENLSISFDFDDEIISSSVLVHNGEIKNERFKK